MKLQFQDFALTAGEKLLYDHFDLELQGPGVTTILGPSGVGKSTLLHAITLMLEEGSSTRWAFEGDIRVDGHSIFAPDVDPVLLRRDLALILQMPVMLDGSVYENIALVLEETTTVPRASWRERAAECLERVGLLDEIGGMEMAAGELSGGQAQRLAIAMRMACSPRVYLLDEPSSALDPEATARIAEVVRDLGREHLVVLVTHEAALARACSDRVVFLNRADGVPRIQADGPVELMDDPQGPLADFLNALSTITKA